MPSILLPAPLNNKHYSTAAEGMQKMEEIVLQSIDLLASTIDLLLEQHNLCKNA